MPNRLDIEITSQTTDSSYTWRSAGAKEPKGTIKASLLPSGVAIGDVLKVEADFMIDGIEITAVLPQKTKKDGPELLELFGTGNAQLPLPPMLMFDRITNIQNQKGKFNKGLVEAELLSLIHI